MPFKKDDKVSFNHVGRIIHGTVINEAIPNGDGKVRIKCDAGYTYRILEDQVRVRGAQPAESVPAETESQTNNTNNLTEEQMAKTKAKAAPAAKKAAPAKKAPATGGASSYDNIARLECRKHQRIFLLSEAGASKEEIMNIAGCNAGEISNAKKMYAGSAEKAAAAKALLA